MGKVSRRLTIALRRLADMIEKREEPSFEKPLRPQWCKRCNMNWTESANDRICVNCLTERRIYG